ncbi:hypothetical protein CRUP_015355 [Coryphaenoides rupestris]|nr:hypothetical protein CRUP_015355 [Coryphaenoides rupestris]
MEDDIRPALTQVTLINMRPDQSYSLRLFATNIVGRSAPSNVVTVTTPEAAPEGPPLDVQLESLTPRSIKITWKPPKTELRNGLLGDYGLSYREQFGRWHHLKVPATAKDTESFALNNLRPATQYYVIVRASTSAGLGPPFIAPPCRTLIEVVTTSTSETTTFRQSTTTLSPDPPDPPVLELLEVKDKQVSLCWTAGFDGGVPISSYELEYKLETASWDSTQRFGGYGPNQTETTLIEMLPGAYSVRLFALNGAGSSAPSNVVTVTIAEKGHPKDLSTLVPHATGTPAAALTPTATPTPSSALTPTARPTPSSALTSTSTPTSSSTLTPAAVQVEKSHRLHPAVVAVPVLLVMVAVALGVIWQVRRMKGRNGILTIPQPQPQPPPPPSSSSSRDSLSDSCQGADDRRHPLLCHIN